MTDKKLPDAKHLDRYKKVLSELPDVDGPIIKHFLDNSELSFRCNCGCHSFILNRDPLFNYRALRQTSHSGCFKELDLKTQYEKALNVLLFIDKQGFLDSVDITFGTENKEPVPDNIEILGIAGMW